jgi:hypothetical protein
MTDKGDGQLALPVSVCYMNSAPASPPSQSFVLAGDIVPGT